MRCLALIGGLMATLAVTTPIPAGKYFLLPVHLHPGTTDTYKK